MGHCWPGEVLLAKSLLHILQYGFHIYLNRRTLFFMFQSPSLLLNKIQDCSFLNRILIHWLCSIQICCTGSPLLPRCSCCSCCVWYNKPRLLCESAVLGEGIFCLQTTTIACLHCFHIITFKEMKFILFTITFGLQWRWWDYLVIYEITTWTHLSNQSIMYEVEI